MLIHGEQGTMFKCKDFTCILNKTFNVVLFTECTAVCNGKAHSVGFSVPVGYLDFIKTVSIENSLESEVTSIFVFEKHEDAQKLREYVLNLPKNSTYQIITGLFPKKQNKPSKEKNTLVKLMKINKK